MDLDRSGPRPAVSVIIAAYGRSAALQRALTSVLQQTIDDLEVLVVCDRVSDEFLESVPRDDVRVRLLNLDRRAGAQYGPNSIGMAHARGDTLSFLNHDDVWLRDHLEISLEVMRSTGSGLHQATAAFITPDHQNPDLFGRLVLGPVSRRARWWWVAVPNHLFEPASAWLIRADVARAAGPWRPPSSTHAVPSLREWLARVMRSGAAHSFDATATVIKINLHHVHSGPKYASESVLHELIDPIVHADPTQVRRDIEEDLDRLRLAGLATTRGGVGPLAWGVRTEARLRTVLYRLVGDPRLLGTRRDAARHAIGVAERTGEPDIVPPSVGDLNATEITR